MSTPESRIFSSSDPAAHSSLPEVPQPPEPPKESPKRLARILIPALALILLLGAVLFAFFPSLLVEETPEIEWQGEGRLLILPFLDRTGEAESGWIRLGMNEMVAEVLSAQPGIEVISPSRVFETLAQRDLLHVEENAPQGRLRQLGQELGAQLILEGTLARSTPPNLRRELDKAVYSLDYTLWEGEKVALDGRLEADAPIVLGYRLTYLLARLLRQGNEPMPVAQVLSNSLFLNRLYSMGRAAKHRSLDEARPYFEICLRYQPNFLNAKLHLAETELSEQPELVRKRLLEVLQETQNRADQRLQARTLMLLARLSQQEDKPDEARRLFGQSSAIWMNLGDLEGQLMIVQGLRDTLPDPQQEEQVTLLEQELEIQRKLGDRLGTARTLIHLGELHLAARDLEQASPLFAEADDLTRQIQDPWLQYRAITAQGQLALQQGNPDAATEGWRQAVEFYQQSGDREQELQTQLKLSEAYLRLNDLENAEDAFFQLKSIAVEMDDLTNEGLASLRLAQILLRRGYPRQAFRQLQRALELDTYIGEHITLQLTIAWMAYEQGNYRLAVETQRAAKRQAGNWGARREAFLKVFEQAQLENRRLPLPGESDS